MILKKFIKPDFILIGSIMFANFANYVFNAILGRSLSLEEYGVLTLINTIWYIFSVFLNGISTTANHSFATIQAQEQGLVSSLYFSLRARIVTFASLFSLLWILLIPVLALIFKVDNLVIFASITPLILIGSFVALAKGYLQGKMLFTLLATLIVSESVSKVVYALLFISLGFTNLAYLSIPLSILTSFIFSLIVVRPTHTHVQHRQPFPRSFYIASVLTSLAGAAFLTVDVLLAKMYLSPTDAGKYALLSLVGKMIYFFGSILNSLVITYTSKLAGEKGDDVTGFYKLFFITCLITIVAYVFVGPLGTFTVPLLLGSRASAVIPYIHIYGLGIAIFTIASAVTTYHLSLKRFVFSRVGFLSTAFLLIGIILFHRDIYTFSWTILSVSVFYFLIIMLMHLYFAHWKKEPKRIVEMRVLDEYIPLLPMQVAVCLPAYNEEKNIGKLLDSLLNQETEFVEISRIVVVSSASTDRTDEIVGEYASQDERIHLIREETRNGKASAINLFLQNCKEPFVVVQSTDTVCDKKTIENLCFPFLADKAIGMTGGAPIPVNNPNTFLGYVVHTWWWFHRHIPRFGEIIAFRNILPEISPYTAVDEAYIQAKFVQMSYKIVHVDEAIVYNKGAENIRDMIKQRRRIYNGHSRLKAEENVKIDHLTKKAIWLLLFKYELQSLQHVAWIIGGIAIELYANILGRWDMYIGNKNPVVWDIATSTKEVS